MFKPLGFAGSILRFVRRRMTWWMVPIVLLVLVLALLIGSGSSSGSGYNLF